MLLLAPLRLWLALGILAGATASYAEDRSTIVRREADWIAHQCVRPSGAIAMNSDRTWIQPYFGNYAALALLAAGPGYFPTVRAWIAWWLAHLKPDGTIDDFSADSGDEKSTGKRDSTDAYAGTLLQLVGAYATVTHDTEFLRLHLPEFLHIAQVLTDGPRTHGLTFAKPDYRIAYLMDNVEVWRGLADFSRVLETLGDFSNARALREFAAKVARALVHELHAGDPLQSKPYLGAPATRWATFYPDATAALWPTVAGFPIPRENRRTSWEHFRRTQPGWETLQADSFPWTLIVLAAIGGGDTDTADRFLESASARARRSHAWPWHVAESAGLIMGLQRRVSVP